MAVTIKAFGQWPLNLMRKLVYDLHASTTVYGALLTSSYTFDQDSHTTWADVSANEVSGSGYTTHGVALTGCTVTYASRVTTFAITTPYTLTFSAVTLTDYQYLVLYDNNTPGTHASDKLICCINLGQTYAASASNVVFTFNTSGIITVTVAA
jgi:hypothetical protein